MTVQRAICQRVNELAKLDSAEAHKLLCTISKPWDTSDYVLPRVPSAFQPTGVDLLDRLVANAGIAFHYGGNEAANVIKNGIEAARDPVTHMIPHNNDEHFIRLPQSSRFDSPKDYRETLAHELIHWVETRTRPQQAGINNMQSLLMSMGLIKPPRHYSIEEAAAEIGAAMLLKAAGLDPDVESRAIYTFMYVSDYPDEMPELLRIAAKHATQDVAYLLRLPEKTP